MNDSELMKAYMSTHVLINSKTPVSEWTDEQMVCAFAMLPAPAVSFDDFKAKLNIGSTPDDLSEEEKIAHNTKTLQLHKGKEAV
jgi:hypothetical protein